MMNEYYSSDSEDEQPPRKRRTFRPRINFSFDDKAFLNRFRVSKSVFESLYMEIGDNFQHQTERNHAFTAKQQLLIALHFLGTGCQYHAVGDMHGASPASVHRFVTKFANLVVDRLFAKYITWPEVPDSTPTGFYRYSGIPFVAGSMDGTLCNIIKPKANEEQYLDRHGNHSLNTMMVCRHNLQFVYVNARYPGSVHDARVLRNSTIFDRFEAGWRPFPGAIIIADSAYPLLDWLVPYRPPKPGNDVEERLFRKLQLSRHLIECAYGVLKQKFPCLNYMRLDPTTAAKVIMTCAVLHNMCLAERDTDEIDDLLEGFDITDDPIDRDEQPGSGRSKGFDDLLRFFQQI